MNPIAFTIPLFGGLEIRYYGIAMALSMLVGAWLTAKLLKKQGRDGELIWDGLVYIIIASIIGARLFYVFTNLGDYAPDPLEAFRVWHGGLSFHGGVIFGGLATYFFFANRGIPFMHVADAMVPGLALGIVLVRIGNLMNGDILGYKWQGPWAMNFPFDEYHQLDPAAVVLRHPTEIYGMLVGVVVFLVGYYMWRRTYLLNTLCPGATFFGLLISYSLARSIIEDPFRDVPLPWKVVDPANYQCGLFTSAQLASIPIILIGIWGLTQVCRWEKLRLENAGKGIGGDSSHLTRQQRRAKQRDQRKGADDKSDA
jgi:phosphatidylglycerol:prolipoprotein diacylglycerol transferase